MQPTEDRGIDPREIQVRTGPSCGRRDHCEERRILGVVAQRPLRARLRADAGDFARGHLSLSTSRERTVEGGNIDLEAKHPVRDIDLASLERTGQPVVFTDYDLAYFGRLRFDPGDERSLMGADRLGA